MDERWVKQLASNVIRRFQPRISSALCGEPWRRSCNITEIWYWILTELLLKVGLSQCDMVRKIQDTVQEKIKQIFILLPKTCGRHTVRLFSGKCLDQISWPRIQLSSVLSCDKEIQTWLFAKDQDKHQTRLIS